MAQPNTATASSFAEVLESLRSDSATHVDLSNCEVGAGELAELSLALMECHSVEHLNLSGNGIAAEGFQRCQGKGERRWKTPLLSAPPPPSPNFPALTWVQEYGQRKRLRSKGRTKAHKRQRMMWFDVLMCIAKKS